MPMAKAIQVGGREKRQKLKELCKANALASEEDGRNDSWWSRILHFQT